MDGIWIFAALGLLVIIMVVALVRRKSDDGAGRSNYRADQIKRAKVASARKRITPSPAKITVNISIGNDKPSRPAVFSSPAIKVLAEEYRGEYHRDYPFLDPDYSPGSHMPFMDLTPQVGEWIAAGDEASLYELWGFIGDFRHEVALREALRVSVPEGFEISDFAKNEMRAIYALTLRMELSVGHGEFTGAVMMATTLSTRNFTMADDLKNALERLVLQEFKKRNKEFESTGNSPDDAREQTRKVMEAVNQGVAGCERFAAIMKTVPPTVGLIEEFGKDYGTYFSILSTIACGRTTRKDIENAVGVGDLGGFLQRLVKDYEIIARHHPLFGKPLAKNLRFRILDNFYLFWFRFIAKYSAAVELGTLGDMIRGTLVHTRRKRPHKGQGAGGDGQGLLLRSSAQREQVAVAQRPPHPPQSALRGRREDRRQGRPGTAQAARDERGVFCGEDRGKNLPTHPLNAKPRQITRKREGLPRVSPISVL